ncbi:MAG: 4-hydroxythreonine-4-phosphate dehydrogenase PdxA [Flavobacteriales bacterium]|nr:MAG: 4-hydroxythreonine-4-phosphate dehydrogenase PdxA [Flavobacteriales bacterium]
MNNSKPLKVGISLGDINGIGIEVILKTFEDGRMLELCTPVIFGSNKTLNIHKNQLKLNIQTQGSRNAKNAIDNKINLVNVWHDNPEVTFGKKTNTGGKYALLSLEAATKALLNNEIDVLVTAPINKHNIQSETFKFNGHTEYLENQLSGESLMILMSKSLRVGLITGHIPVSEIATSITPKLIEKKVNIMYNSLVRDFCIKKPKIAVLGLNPHAGDNGLIGSEDQKIVTPVLEKFQSNGQLVYGPYAADSFFGSGTYTKFDGVLAMYHDQGLGPFKTIAFGGGVNFTAGLDKIRTSPDHGTGFDIAGLNKADHNSFKEAVYTALDIYRNRETYLQFSENALKNEK